MKGFIKKNIFLIVISITVAFFYSSTIYLIQKQISTSSIENDFLSFDTINFRIDSNNAKKISNYLTNLSYNYVLVRQEKSPGSNHVDGIYFKGKLNKSPKMLQGRFFEEKDFNNKNKYIVIGKELRDGIVKRDNVDYFYVNNEYYKVIGILGDKKEASYYDQKTYVNLDSLLDKDKTMVLGEFSVDALSKSEKVYKDIKSQYAKDNIKVDKTVPFYKASLTESITTNYKEDILSSAKTIAPLIITILLITSYWAKKRTKEIAIKRTLGATRMRIAIHILSEFITICTFSFILGYVLFLIVSYVQDGYIHFYIETVSIVFVVTILTGLASTIVPIVKAIKVEPSEMMR